VLTALLAVLSLQVAPAATSRMLEMRSEAMRAGQFAPISAGKFSTFGGGGSTVVYAQSADKDGTLRRVFVQRSRGSQIEIALAQRATHAYSEGGDLQVITLYDGERYEGIPGERKFRIVRFAENTIPVRLPPLSDGALQLGGVPTAVLAVSGDPLQRAEFHWRSAVPIMGVIMALIGVPLARLRPRQGRYARVAFAILVFYLYISSPIAGRFWLERGVTPGWLGLWWVHAGCRAVRRRAHLCAAMALTPIVISATCAAVCAGGGRPHEQARPLCHSRSARAAYSSSGGAAGARRVVHRSPASRTTSARAPTRRLDALWFVLLNLPQQMYETMPIAVMIGALLGLGSLARGSELTVMRAAGISVWRIAGSVCMAGVLLVFLAVLCGEFIAPPLQAMAKQQKLLAKFPPSHSRAAPVPGCATAIC
jgi:lipopolysaccharide export LptBFGC system permease protein LptF